VHGDHVDARDHRLLGGPAAEVEPAVEQPLPPRELDAMAEVRRAIGVPLMAIVSVGEQRVTIYDAQGRITGWNHTLVGQSIGAGDRPWAYVLGNRVILLASIYMGGVGVLLAVCGPWLLPLFALASYTWSKTIDDVSRIMASPGDEKALRAAWEGWHTISPPMRQDYQRFVELSNKGAKALGFADTGAMWRSKYDMRPDEFTRELDRLWDQVRPLYLKLHAYVRMKLREKYGDAVPENGPIPAHLLGNIWAQDWGNVLDLVAPGTAGPGYSVGDDGYARGVPLATAFRYDTGVEGRIGDDASLVSVAVALTNGTLSAPGSEFAKRINSLELNGREREIFAQIRKTRDYTHNILLNNSLRRPM
jgi:hypothetical protein